MHRWESYHQVEELHTLPEKRHAENRKFAVVFGNTNENVKFTLLPEIYQR